MFYTNYDSRKARALNAYPVASASFWWPTLMRQVRAVGATSRIPRPRSEAYFATRPRASQIEAWASHQSEPLARRADLLDAVREAEVRFAGREVPCPPNWGGYVVDVDTFEFWQGLPGRLHDRVLLLRTEDGWRGERLQP
ncbi:pyridoxal 5'-phosphate synthase [Tessaracoccus coleopterorum]